ncbi:MAG: type II toxin-antitoxin system HicA family toxin [bacterium]|nr:type II toxin-antitoxin system HicA family toxin [bacterium]MDE0601948.1 type II toxin-antitoxin system HicA family toxin [bacterium]
MTRRLTPISRRALIKRFRRLGWEGPRTGAKQDFMVKGQRKVRIPNPHRRDVGVDLLYTILKQAGICRETWRRTS